MTYPKHQYYKYCHLYSDRGNKIPNSFTRSLIESSELFYATPASFNDPFDCNLRLHVDDSTDADWIRYLDALIAQYPERTEQFTIVKNQRLWTTHPELCAFGITTRQTIYNESSVLCLSKRPDSIPMFSYYADDHHGIAVELEFSEDEIPCGIPYGDPSQREQLYQRKIVIDDIEYVAAMPELNYHRLYESHQLIKSLIFTKFDGWRHEDEFRIFRKGIAASVVKFPQAMLKRIIFGARTTADDVGMVKGWLSQYHHGITLAKAEVSTTSFSLDIHTFEHYILP